ncbi:MAG: LamG-like jellyroll fold domain-containing protein [Acidimicrobiales bacterium]
MKTTNTGFDPILSKLGPGANLQGWEMGTYSGVPYLFLDNTYPGNSLDAICAVSIADGRWHHLVVTYNGASNVSAVQFYIDGVAAAQQAPFTNSLTATTKSNAPLSIGGRPGNPAYLFAGSLADVAVYPNAVLPAGRVAAHHVAGGQSTATTQSAVVYNTAYPNAVQADHPARYWRLGDPSGTVATDSGAAANNATYNNVTLAQPGGLYGDNSTSARFSSSYASNVALPPSTIIAPGGSTSIEAWFNTQVGGPILGIQAATVGQPTSASYVPMVYVGQDGVLRGEFWPGGLLASPGAVNDGHWHHVALTFDGTTQTLYLDGTQVGTGTSGFNGLKMVNNQIGAAYTAYYPSTPGGWWYFNGQISDVAVYHAALGGTSVRAHYRAGALPPYAQTVLSDSPTSLWRLADPAGALQAVDSAGSNPLNPANVNFAQPGPLTDGATSVDLPGANNYSSLSAPNIAQYDFSNTQPFSIEYWANTTNQGVQAVASTDNNAAPYAGWETGLNAGQPYVQLINTWPSNAIDVQTVTSVADGNWHHVILSYDGSSKAAGVHFYIDGKPVATITVYDTLTASSATTNPVTVGTRDFNNFYYSGRLADVAIYPTALSAGQDATHYQVGTTPVPAPSTVHQIAVTDQQYVSGGQLALAGPAATFNPNYSLTTSTVDADGKTTATSYSDAAHGIGPQYGMATSATQDPGGLNLTSATTYETPGPGSYLRVTAKTLPAGNQTGYVSYCGYPTDPTCAAPEQPGAWATACGITAGTSQYGLVAQRTDPAPATGPGDALVEQYLYDTAGRQTGVRKGTVSSIATAGWSCVSYDGQGRIATQSWPAFGTQPARSVTYSYQIGGNPLVNSVTDTNWPGASITSTVDLADRVVSYTDIYNNTTTTSYDQVGRQTATSSPAGTIGDSYDPATGRQSTVTDNGTTLATSTYDSNGQLSSV